MIKLWMSFGISGICGPICIIWMMISGQERKLFSDFADCLLWRGVCKCHTLTSYFLSVQELLLSHILYIIWWGEALLQYVSILPISKSKNEHVGSDTKRISDHPVCTCGSVCVQKRHRGRKINIVSQLSFGDSNSLQI